VDAGKLNISTNDFHNKLHGIFMRKHWKKYYCHLII